MLFSKKIVSFVLLLYIVSVILAALVVRYNYTYNIAVNNFNNKVYLLDSFSQPDTTLRPLAKDDILLKVPSIMDITIDMSKPIEGLKTDFYIQGYSPHPIDVTTDNIMQSFKKNKWLVTIDGDFLTVSAVDNGLEFEGLIIVEKYENSKDYKSRILGVFSQVN